MEKYSLHYCVKLLMLMGILQMMHGFQQAKAFGANFEPFFRLAQEKQDTISVAQFISFYERFWDAHRDQYIAFLKQMHERRPELFTNTSLTMQGVAEVEFARERNKFSQKNRTQPLTQAQLPGIIRELIMYFPPTPFEQEFRTQLWRWLQDR